MQKKLVYILIGMMIFLMTACASGKGDSLKNAHITNLESEISQLKVEKSEVVKENAELKEELKEIKKQIPDRSDEIEPVETINFIGQETIVETSQYNSLGFEINRFIEENEGFIKMKNQKTNDDFDEEVPTQFSLNANDKSITFYGLVYIGASGSPMVEYIGGEYGEYRAKYFKGSINILSKNVLESIFLDLEMNVEINYEKE